MRVCCAQHPAVLQADACRGGSLLAEDNHDAII